MIDFIAAMLICFGFIGICYAGSLDNILFLILSAIIMGFGFGIGKYGKIQFED